MASKDEMIIERVSVENAEEILELQKLAYISEAEIINDFTIPPLHQTIDEIISEFKHQVLLKVELDNGIIGSVRCYIENRTCFIGKLIVHPKYQNFGIGTKLLYEVENQFPEAKRYELFTSQKSEKNLHIYLKKRIGVRTHDLLFKLPYAMVFPWLDNQELISLALGIM